MNKTPGSSPPTPSAIKEAIARLEEKCAVIDAAEAAWDSRQLSDDTKLRILISVRRTLIDVIVGLEERSRGSDIHTDQRNEVAMSTTILTDAEIFGIFDTCSDLPLHYDPDEIYAMGRAIEQAVLQSEQVQAWKRDAAAFRLMVSLRLTVKVDEVCSDVEVFHLGECLAWPPAHHCENDEEVAAVAREAIQKAAATLKEQS